MTFPPSLLHSLLVAAVLLVSASSTACLDAPIETETEPQARVIVAWDPLDCGEPHRVAVELEDDNGYPASTSTWCGMGSVSLDVRHFGIYRGRIFAWSSGEIRAEMAMHLAVDEPVMRWYVPTPK